MNLLLHCVWLALLAFSPSVSGHASETNSASAAEAAYTRTVTQRSDKIVSAFAITDSNKARRVRDIIVQQYRDLNSIHNVRDAQIKSAMEKSDTDKTVAETAIQTASGEAKPRLNKLHGEFLARLSAELSPEQVNEVKDGMTYGVMPLTYSVYLKMYPELTDEQKQQIMAWLVEARELAMDGSTSEEKHAVFGKYKGKINNFLSGAGYDAKKGEQSLRKTSPPKSETKAN